MSKELEFFGMPVDDLTFSITTQIPCYRNITKYKSFEELRPLIQIYFENDRSSYDLSKVQQEIRDRSHDCLSLFLSGTELEKWLMSQEICDYRLELFTSIKEYNNSLPPIVYHSIGIRFFNTSDAILYKLSKDAFEVGFVEPKF